MLIKNIIPQHIAIIMDGNGRWAKARKLPRIAGHRQGAKVVKATVKACDKLGVKYLTLYTFSTENWKRPQGEIDFLMQLLSGYLKKQIQTLIKNNVQFKTIGKIKSLPLSAQKVISEAKQVTKKNTGLTLILALNYGSRAEILSAVLKVSEDITNDKLDPNALNEEIFSNYLFTAGIPDPDLMIRTSGEMRLSNYLLWQLSYSEIYVTNKFWPDFDKHELDLAVESFQKRKRRFGAIEERDKHE